MMLYVDSFVTVIVIKLGLFGSSKNNSKSDNLKVNKDDDFDIDINVFNTPTYLRNKKRN